MEKIKNINRILVISFEAGSAEIISEFILQKKEKLKVKYSFVLNKTTKNIFKKKGFKIQTTNKQIKFDNIKKILFGASFFNQEINFIKKKKLTKIQNICLLDHWVNFEKRFLNNKKIFSPNKIYVFDKYALNRLKKISFKNTIIQMIKNPLTKNIKRIKNKKRKNIVIFLNNIEYQNRKMTDTKFISNKSLIENSIDYINKKKLLFNQIYIKLHPANDRRLYENYIKNFKNLEIIKKKNIRNIFQHTKLAISNESMTLFISKKYGIDNLNITKNKDPIIPREYCKHINYIK